MSPVIIEDLSKETAEESSSSMGQTSTGLELELEMDRLRQSREVLLYPSLYQLNTRVLLGDLSRQIGKRATLDDFPDAELDRLAAAGFNWLWFLGVWQTGPAGRRVRWRTRDGATNFGNSCPIFARRMSVVRALPSALTPFTPTSEGIRLCSGFAREFTSAACACCSTSFPTTRRRTIRG